MSTKPTIMSYRFVIFALLCALVSGAILEKRPYVILGNPDGASEPAVRGGGALSEVPHEATLAAPATPATPAPAAIAATAAAPASLATPPTSATPSLTTPAPTSGPVGPPGCGYEPCNLFYQYVNVYYWPEEGPFRNDTACLSAHAPVAAAHPVIPNIQSPSVYVIFPSIVASDGCSQIGNTFADMTTSFAPGALSTVGLDHSTRSFNFGDLPCPPANVGWDPASGPYAPLLAPPEFLFQLDPAFSTCIPGATQGIDPYTTLTAADAGSGPGNPGCGKHCKRHRRALQHAHPVPWASEKTTARM